MRKKIDLGNIFIAAPFVFVLLITLSAANSDQRFAEKSQAEDTLAADRKKYIRSVWELIKGREKKASDSVFENIQILKGIPAGRLLAIMDIAYSQSLGVSCGHCHNTNKWESDEKTQKQVAREMSVMLSKTKELIKGIKGLRSENPTINCTTCHRGAIKPALDLE